MRLVCAPETYAGPVGDDALRMVLYGSTHAAGQGSAGAAVVHQLRRKRLFAAPRAWDFLSLALSALAADLAGRRRDSPDGWTREFELEVAVGDLDLWAGHQRAVEEALAFLTTDRWSVRFIAGGFRPPQPPRAIWPAEDSVMLVSGGLDSLVGAIDLATVGRRPMPVSQTVRGDASKQSRFARRTGSELHLPLSHNTGVPSPKEPSQRARSLIFLAYGVLAATTLSRYRAGDEVILYVCENGFISVNPPLTAARVGSLSTRTTHPVFLGRVQRLLDALGLRVRIENPYQLATKGEMLARCADQELLRTEAAASTSCGRFQRYGYTHCGRCVPCQIRRAAFLQWDIVDTTQYVFTDLGRPGPDHAGFDDVRSAAMAIVQVRADGLDRWLGTSLSTALLGDVAPLKAMVQRGLDELDRLHQSLGVA